MLYSSNASSFVLGALCNNTHLLTCGQYFFMDKGKDFECEKFQVVVFRAISNLAKTGCSSVDAKDIYEHLKPHKSALTIFENSNGLDYIKNIKRLSNEETFAHYYNIVRKYSMLRSAKTNNINIDDIYDEAGSESQQEERLSNLTINDIISLLESKLYELKMEFMQDQDNTTEKRAGENSKEVFDGFKNKDYYGVTFEDEFLTEIYGGFRKQQLYMISSDTGGGKSRTIIGNIAKIGMKKLYNLETQKWEDNPCYCNASTLYIGSEMELGQEVEPLFVAYVLGLSSSTITKGNATDEQYKLIYEALDIMLDSNLFLIDMPEFNCEKLEQKIKYYKSKHGIDFVGFDYIALTNTVVNEFMRQRGSGVGTRGDEILLALAESLKQMAKKYDIGIITATQVNALIKDYMNRSYEVIRGSKSLADKLTGGSIGMLITKQELSLVEPHILKYNLHRKTNLQPNFVETVYKSRFSEYPKELKIFSNYDLGTMRKTSMFVTTKDFEPIDIPRLRIETNKATKIK